MAKKGGKRKAAAGDVATNRQAGYRYEFLDKLEAGIQLQGTEGRSVREGGVQLKDSYAAIRDGEVWLHNAHIAPYAPASRENHDPERPRKLLLHRREIDRLVAERGPRRAGRRGRGRGRGGRRARGRVRVRERHRRARDGAPGRLRPR